jgi:hypothetical protein
MQPERIGIGATGRARQTNGVGIQNLLMLNFTAQQAELPPLRSYGRARAD